MLALALIALLAASARAEVQHGQAPVRDLTDGSFDTAILDGSPWVIVLYSNSCAAAAGSARTPPLHALTLQRSAPPASAAAACRTAPTALGASTAAACLPRWRRQHQSSTLRASPRARHALAAAGGHLRCRTPASVSRLRAGARRGKPCDEQPLSREQVPIGVLPQGRPVVGVCRALERQKCALPGFKPSAAPLCLDPDRLPACSCWSLCGPSTAARTRFRGTATPRTSSLARTAWRSGAYGPGP